MKKYVLLAACIAAFTGAGAQPKSDVTYTNITETYTINPDGSLEHNVRKTFRYNTQYSFFKLFGETFVVYNPDGQSLKINECRTTQPDGNVVVAPDNAFNEVLPSFAADAPDYNGLREMVISHTGLETGAVAVLDYTITSRPGFCDFVSIDRVLSEPGADIREYRIVVKDPSGAVKDCELSGASVKPRVQGDTYVWVLRNIPVGSGEAYTPRGRDGLPHLCVTTSPSLQNTLAPFAAVSQEVCRAPQRVLDGKNTEQEKIAAIHSFVLREIGPCGVRLELAGGHLRSCSRVLETAYGTDAERAFVMASLLRAEGIDADVVAVYPKNMRVKTLGGISQFLVRCDGRFYSPLSAAPVNVALRADRDDIFDMSGRPVEVEPQTVKISSSASLTLSAGAVTLDGKTVEASGLGALSLAAGRAENKDGYTVYTLPVTDWGVDGWRMNILNTGRREYFEIPYAVEQTCDFEISLSGIASLTPDTRIVKSNSAGRVELTVENRDGKVFMHRSLKIDKTLFSAREYDDVRTLLLLWSNPAFRQVVAR